MNTKFSRITRLHDGKVFAMISTESNEVHFAVKKDKYRAFVAANRKTISIIKFSGKSPNASWLIAQGEEAIKLTADK